MSDSICKFIPAKDYSYDLKTVHFVYETEHSSLPQPFLRPIYYMFLVTDGTATFKIPGSEHKVSVGDIFIGFPGCPYELISEGAFRYLYISFFGSCVSHIFKRLGIGIEKPVFRGFDKMLEHWVSAISMFNAKNAELLSESVLLYTLSAIGGEGELAEIKKNAGTMFEMVLEYVDNHYRDPSLCLSSVASIFFYTESYLSALFKRHMEIGFNQYINRLRISYALRLIDDGYSSVREIAERSGFSDALYFSKVFKKKVGMTPTEKIKNR